MIKVALFLVLFFLSDTSDPKLPSATFFKVDGNDAFVMEAKNEAKEKPWVWYAPTLRNYPNNRHSWYFDRLFARGISIAGIDLGEVRGSPASNLRFTAFYDEMVRRGFSKRPILLGQSRGGLMMLSWATGNPDKLSAFVGIYPVCNLASWPLKDSKAAVLKDYSIPETELMANLQRYNPTDNLRGLLDNRIPVFIIHGTADEAVPFEENSKLVFDRYKEGRGKMEVEIVKGGKHEETDAFFECQKLLDFIFRINKSPKAFTVVSIPDFLNVDCDYPQKGWEDALNYVLNSVKKENPEFVLVAGDLVMGHWDNKLWNDADSISKYSRRYYSNWINRMNDHDLPFNTALGDHDIGDDAWRDEKKFRAVGLYKKAFSDLLKMPQNGPDHMKGTAFWWRFQNVLFISVDVFEEGKSDLGFIKIGVTGDQLNWVRKVLDSNSDAEHRIIMGHVPVLGPVRRWSSSMLNIEEGRESGFWQLMKKYGVDAYLCGEVHAITCTERDGIMQVAHGGLLGYNTRINYLVMKFTRDKIRMEIREIEMMPHGGFLWQTKNNRPLENITISDSVKARGFNTVGRLTIDKSDKKEFKNREGYFLQKYESSDEKAFPIFRKNENPSVPTELPKISMKPEIIKK